MDLNPLILNLVIKRSLRISCSTHVYLHWIICTYLPVQNSHKKPLEVLVTEAIYGLCLEIFWHPELCIHTMSLWNCEYVYVVWLDRMLWCILRVDRIEALYTFSALKIRIHCFSIWMCVYWIKFSLIAK